MSDGDKVTTAHCNDCGGDRRHDVLHSETKNFTIDDVGIWGGDRYETLRCRGCEGIRLRHTTWDSERRQHEEEDQVVYYPPAAARREPPWMFDLWLDQPGIGGLLREVYIALQNGSARLAGMGIRALVEQVMIDKVKDQGTFGKNLTAFEQAGYISSRQAAALADILDAGHATMHRGWVPSQEDLGTLLDVTETMIETVYFHEGKAALLKRRVPPRTP